MGKPVTALKTIARVLGTDTDSNLLTLTQRAHLYQLQARALRALGRHQDALPAFAAASAYATEAGNHLLALQVRVGEIDSLVMLGQWDEATILAQYLETSLKAEGAFEDAARVIGNIGSLYLRNDRYEAALRSYEQGESLLDMTSSPRMRAGMVVNQAIALTYLGRYDDAQQRYTAAQELYLGQDAPFEAAVVDANIGFLHYSAGRYGVALAHLTRASQAFQQSGREHELARCEVDRGDVYQASNLFTEAEVCYRRAISIFLRLPLDYDHARAELGCAASLFAQGRTVEAEAILERAEGRFAALSNSIQLAHTHLLRAHRLRQTGNADAAREAALSAEATFAQHSLAGWAAEARLLAIQDAEDDPDLLSGLEEIITTARAEARGWLESRAERMLGQIYLRAGQRFAAVIHLRRSVAALESIRVQIAPEELHLSFLTDKEEVYAELIELLLSDPFGEAEITEALQALEQARSRMLLERILRNREGDTPALQSGVLSPEARGIWDRLVRLRAELSRTYRDALSLEDTETRRQSPVRNQELTDLEMAYSRLVREADVAGLLPRETFLSSPLDVARLQQTLAPEETLLLYAHIGGCLGAFVVRCDSVDVVPKLALWEEVEYAARRLRYHLQKMELAPELRALLSGSLLPEVNQALSHLYDLVLRPLTHLLNGNRLILAPCHPLHNLPFHALRVDNQYVLDLWEMVYTPSAAVWQALAERDCSGENSSHDSPQKFVVGVSEYGIARVTEEIEAVAGLLDSPQVLSEKEATVSAVRTALGQSSICHLATHALFRKDNPLFSGLHLADGWLLARDLYEMSVNAELVTLSACSTGSACIAPGGEWMGLARGFLAAGTKRVVASLWPADDAATTDLMTQFYAFRETHSTAAALRAAQQEIRKRWPHPYYWGAFCTIGSP
jgi:CHAT domain-containing protein